MHNQSKVRLPEWIFETAENEEQLKRLIIAYVNKRYEGYTVLKVKGLFAICQVSR